MQRPTLNVVASVTYKSISRNGKKSAEHNVEITSSRSYYLIAENCYLIFAIHKNFAIELKDVQKIIDSEDVMYGPGATGFQYLCDQSEGRSRSYC